MFLSKLLPLANADIIRQLDQLTCERQGISSLELMERAAGRCTEKLLELYPHNKFWTIIAGCGNNGGDGLVIARQLFMRGHEVRVYRSHQQCCSNDHLTNAKRLERLLPTDDVESFSAPSYGVLIDALFGVGLSRELEAPYADWVEVINRSEAPIVSIDMPSGMTADFSLKMDAPIVCATHTLCLGAMKPSLLWQEYETQVGTLHFLPIGLDVTATAEVSTSVRWLDATWISEQYRLRRRFAHKGEAGRLLMIAGSRGMTGAAVLAAQAALHSGCGLLTAHLPTDCLSSFHARVVEAMSDPDTHAAYNTDLAHESSADALLLGCGLGTQPETAALLHSVITRYSDKAMVWDADALNLLSQDSEMQKNLPPHSVLTPHPGEFARLYGHPLQHDSERITAAQSLAQRLRTVVVLKGKYSVIADANGNTVINPTGNAGMAKGGSGDVLAGMIAALLAQGYAPFIAAAMSTYLHGLAGDIALAGSSVNSLIAQDIIAAIPKAFMTTFSYL